MDPLSITAGVFGILGSLAALTLQTKEIYGTLQEARPEIQQLTDEVDALKLILKQIDKIHSQGGIARNLIDDLASVLQRLNFTIVETECFLRNSLKKSFRAAAWVFSGKTKSVQFCRRLESYKSTLNITLLVSTVSSGQELHGRADQILGGINDIRHRIPRDDDYILQRFLSDLETVYEGSTIIGAIEPDVNTVLSARSENAADVQIQEWTPEHIPQAETSHLEPVGDFSRLSASPDPGPSSALPTVSQDTRSSHQTGLALVAEVGGTQGSPKTNTHINNSTHGPRKPISEVWKSSAGTPEVKIYLKQIGAIVAASGRTFAVAYPKADRRVFSYGRLEWGDLEGEHHLRNFSIPLNWATPYPGSSLEWSSISANSKSIKYLKLQNENNLIGVFGFQNGDQLHQFVVCWHLDRRRRSQARVSPLLEVNHWQTSALSRTGKLFAYYDEAKRNISIRSVGSRWGMVNSISPDWPMSAYHEIVFSQNEEKIMLCYMSSAIHELSDIDCRMIDVYEITGARISRFSLDELAIEPKIGTRDYPLRYFFTGVDDDILVVGGYLPRDRCDAESEQSTQPQNEIEAEHPKTPTQTSITETSIVLTERNFCATMNTATKTLKFHNIGHKHEQIYKNPIFAPDGSCFLVTRDGFDDVGSPWLRGFERNVERKQHRFRFGLYNYTCMIDSKTGEGSKNFELPNRRLGFSWYEIPYTFHDTGTKIVILSIIHPKPEGQLVQGEIKKVPDKRKVGYDTNCRMEVWV
ncbi:hypothetical protein TWF694_001311 [Orbilia ellipsospora]|uniref:Fungal N-terminal domain-containing protein n=1 Tax=Orbilia ellipsospora TaxID=2528407 RepID=A0AAV9XR91_9PEZI